MHGPLFFPVLHGATSDFFWRSTQLALRFDFTELFYCSSARVPLQPVCGGWQCVESHLDPAPEEHRAGNWHGGVGVMWALLADRNESAIGATQALTRWAG